MAEDLLDELQTAIEQRVRDQLARHLAISPNVDLRRIVDIQIGQERERLAKMAEKLEEEGNVDAAETMEVLIDEWLPFLAKQLKGR